MVGKDVLKAGKWHGLNCYMFEDQYVLSPLHTLLKFDEFEFISTGAYSPPNINTIIAVTGIGTLPGSCEAPFKSEVVPLDPPFMVESKPQDLMVRSLADNPLIVTGLTNLYPWF